MAQDTIKMGTTSGSLVEIWQPEEGLKYSFVTTYEKSRDVAITGSIYGEPLFTRYQLGYSAKCVPVQAARTILQMIAKGRNFYLHYWSPYHGAWRTDLFSCGQSQDITIGTLEEGFEYYETLSFNMTGVDALD